MSIGVIIAIIICVVVLITIFAIVIVCCCCKHGGNAYDQHSTMKMKRQTGTNPGSSSQRPAIEPSGMKCHSRDYIVNHPANRTTSVCSFASILIFAVQSKKYIRILTLLLSHSDMLLQLLLGNSKVECRHRQRINP